jgi:hypothetical protein
MSVRMFQHERAEVFRSCARNADILDVNCARNHHVAKGGAYAANGKYCNRHASVTHSPSSVATLVFEAERTTRHFWRCNAALPDRFGGRFLTHFSGDFAMITEEQLSDHSEAETEIDDEVDADEAVAADHADGDDEDSDDADGDDDSDDDGDDDDVIEASDDDESDEEDDDDDSDDDDDDAEKTETAAA